MTIFARALTSFLAAAALALSATSGNAMTRCETRDAALAHLEQTYAEQVIGRGLTSGGRAMVEVLVSDAGSWTVVVTDTRGRTCLLAEGDDWMLIAAPVGDPA